MKCGVDIDARDVEEMYINIDPIQAGWRLTADAMKAAIAFGDGGNDVDMLRFAGIGVAMGNATDEPKAAADYVTDSVDDAGIANALKHFGVI